MGVFQAKGVCVCVCEREEEENGGTWDPMQSESKHEECGKGEVIASDWSMEGAWKVEAAQAEASLGGAFSARLGR